MNLNLIFRHKVIKQVTTQQGIALPLTMLLLFVMTLIGVSVLRTTVLEEDMAGNSRLRLVAFNAAQATLGEAEYLLFEVSKNISPATTRQLFFTGLRPVDGTTQTGDLCQGSVPNDADLGGFCTPVQFDSGSATLVDERWDDATLDVWNTANRHRVYSNYAASDLDDEGVFSAPKYIIEFLGNFAFKDDQDTFQTNCATDPVTGNILAPNDKWPFCAADPANYRVTVRASAGPVSREAVVVLQSTVLIP